MYLAVIFVCLCGSYRNHASHAVWHDEDFKITKENITQNNDSIETSTKFDYYNEHFIDYEEDGNETRSTKNGAITADDTNATNYYKYAYDADGNEIPSTESDKNVTLRERECVPLSACYFYSELLNHPSLPREVVEKELQKQECGFNGVNNERKGRKLFENLRILEYIFSSSS